MVFQIVFIAAIASLAAASVIPIHHAPQPYKFGYDIKDKHSEQYRQEEGVGGEAVKGSYGFTDARGVKRQVDYVADHAGFRAAVKTNEPGTANQNPAAVAMISEAPYVGGVALAPPRGVGGLEFGINGLGLGVNGLGLGANGLGLGVNGLRLGADGLGLGANGLGLGANGLGLGVGRLGQGVAGLGLGYGVVAPGYSSSSTINGVGLGGLVL